MTVVSDRIKEVRGRLGLKQPEMAKDLGVGVRAYQSWERDDTPDPLGMPLQFMVTADAVSRVNRYADTAQSVAFNPVGQIVGSMNEVISCRDLIYQMVEEYVDSVERLQKLMPS